jgi:hypothetical protein
MEEEGVRQLETIMRTGHAALASSSNTKDSQLFPEQSHGTTLLFCFDFVFFLICLILPALSPAWDWDPFDGTPRPRPLYRQ